MFLTHPYWIGLAVCLLSICFDPDALRAETRGACDPCLTPRARAVVPVARIAILQLGMHVGATALWPEGYNPLLIEKNSRQLRRSFTKPPHFQPQPNIFASDGDWWYFNLAAHGLFGSEGYLAGRDVGWGILPSFGYAVLASVTWEYLVEGRYKQPSLIDLIWTPIGGLLLGELRYWLYRRITTRIHHRLLRVTLKVVINPLGAFQDLLMGCR